MSLDEGLQTLSAQVRAKAPNATIYYIGDGNHSTDPDVSQHAPDDGKSSDPGDTRGEYDAVDVMPGKGVTEDDLDRWFAQLCESRDPRILYVIRRQQICSSVVSPWKIRKHAGAYHGHLHVSVNDRYAANRGRWEIGDPVEPRPIGLITVDAKLPLLMIGDEDPSPAQPGKFQHVKRLQVNANFLDSTVPDLDVDGVYGAKTEQKLGRIMAKAGDARTKAGMVGEAEWRRLFGLYRP